MPCLFALEYYYSLIHHYKKHEMLQFSTKVPLHLIATEVHREKAEYAISIRKSCITFKSYIIQTKFSMLD